MRGRQERTVRTAQLAVCSDDAPKRRMPEKAAEIVPVQARRNKAPPRPLRPAGRLTG